MFTYAKVWSILQSPIFGEDPFTSFGLATALLVACGYLVPTVFIETGLKI